MTDLDILRRALRAQDMHGCPGRDGLDVGEIIVRGRRLRWRRRVAAAGGAMCLAAAVFGAVTGVSHLARSSPAPAQHPAGSTRSILGLSPTPAVTRPPARTPTPSPSGPPAPKPTGAAGRQPIANPSPSPTGPTSGQPAARPSPGTSAPAGGAIATPSPSST